MPLKTSHTVELVGEQPAHIPDGVYVCRFEGYLTKYMFGRCPKLYLRFSTFLCGQQYMLDKYYNVKEIVGSCGAQGKFKLGRRSNFYRDYLRLFGSFPLTLDQMAVWEGKCFLCEVKSVKKDAAGDELEADLQYSKIAKIIEQALDTPYS